MEQPLVLCSKVVTFSYTWIFETGKTSSMYYKYITKTFVHLLTTLAKHMQPCFATLQILAGTVKSNTENIL
jgi:hypothetical protein